MQTQTHNLTVLQLVVLNWNMQKDRHYLKVMHSFHVFHTKTLKSSYGSLS